MVRRVQFSWTRDEDQPDAEARRRESDIGDAAAEGVDADAVNDSGVLQLPGALRLAAPSWSLVSSRSRGDDSGLANIRVPVRKSTNQGVSVDGWAAGRWLSQWASATADRGLDMR